jgi:hypothetical protein
VVTTYIAGNPNFLLIHWLSRLAKGRRTLFSIENKREEENEESEGKL